MKFALISQAFVTKSYKVENGIAYTLDGRLYEYSHSVGSDFFLGFWNYPFLFNGYYLNFSDLDKVDEDFDLIMLANDRIKEFSVDVIRKKFPNAFILGTAKEMSGDPTVRKDLFDKSDDVCLPLSENNDIYNAFQQLTDKKIHWIPQPVNIDYLHNNYYDNKHLSIFAYQHHQVDRYADTKQVATYLSQKYNVPMIENYTQPNTHGNNQLQSHLDSWTNCVFMVNNDPSSNYGQQSTLCAACGTINIGGNNDANKYLFPTTNTTDLKQIETEFEKLATDDAHLFKTIEYAWDQVNKLYSYDAVRNKIIDICQ